MPSHQLHVLLGPRRGPDLGGAGRHLHPQSVPGLFVPPGGRPLPDAGHPPRRSAPVYLGPGRLEDQPGRRAGCRLYPDVESVLLAEAAGPPCFRRLEAGGLCRGSHYHFRCRVANLLPSRCWIQVSKDASEVKLDRVVMQYLGMKIVLNGITKNIRL